MPNNILKDFFYGNINPNEKQFDRNSEYGKAAAGLADEEEKLRSMLDQEAATVLDRMICLQAAIAGMTAEEYFIDGLRTGFRLALAILDEEARTGTCRTSCTIYPARKGRAAARP